MLRTRSARSHRWSVAAAVAALLVGTVAMGTPARTEAQAPDEPLISLDVSQSTDLVDGQVIDEVVTPAAGVTLNGVIGTLRLCQNDASFSGGGSSGSPPADLGLASGKCPAPSSPLPPNLTRTSSTLWPMPDAASMIGSIRVGVGTTAQTETGETSLTCGPDDPCTLVAYAPVSPGRWAVDTATLTFAPPDPTAAACGSGSADGAISAIGPDRMSAANVAWTIAQCRATGDKKSSSFVGAATDTENENAPAGEQRALADLASGERDLAYSAVSPSVAGFTPPDQRGMVAVPVAVNAMVVGVAGGFLQEGATDWPAGLPRPFHGVELTVDELASLFGRSLHSHFIPTYGPAVRQRNAPQMDVDLNRTSGGGTLPVVYGPPHAGTNFFTTYLDTLAPDVWKASPTAGDGPDRGVYSKFSAAQPGFNNVLDTASSMSGFEKAYYSVEEATNSFGPGYFLTDYATAQRLGLSLVAIPDATGELVAPTDESITKGLSTMTAQPDGMLAPDPGKSAPGAYPLTMVEYAMAPAEPLVDSAANCLRATSQLRMTDWLTFVTGEGQAAADDFVPLTAGLKSEAAAAIAKVGATTPATAPAGVCGQVGPSPTSPTTPAPLVPSVPPFDVPPADELALGPTGSTGAVGDADAGAVAAPAAQASSAADKQAAKKAADEADIKIPPFLGIAAVSEVISPLALLFVALLTSAAAFGTSGRPIPVPHAVTRRIGRRRDPSEPPTRRRLGRLFRRR